MTNSPESASHQVRHNEAKNRFEIQHKERLAVLEYELEDGVIDLTHTRVPKELEGGGIGSKLAKAALDYAKKNDLKVIPSCPFIITYVQRHPEYEPLIRSGESAAD